MATDPGTDKKVRKKLTGTLRAWHSQYKDEPTMKTAANLYKPSMSRVRTVAKAQVSKDEALEATKRKDKDAERERKKAGAGKLKHKQKTFNFEEVSEFCLTPVLRKAIDPVSFFLSFRRNQKSLPTSRAQRKQRTTLSMP